MSNFKKRAIQLTNGMTITYPLWGGKTEEIKLELRSPKTYNIVGSRITFIDEIGDVFAIPAIKGVESSLISEGYVRDSNLHVYFASGEAYPTSNKEDWDALLQEMRAS